MEKNTNKTLWAIIGIVVLIVLGFMIFGTKDNVEVANTDTNTGTDMNTVDNSGSNGSNAGNTGGTGANAGTVAGGLPTDATLMAIMNNSKVRVPQTGTDVALTQGSGSYTNASAKGTVALGSILGKIATNDGWDVFVTMSVTETGKATSQNHIALFHAKGDVVTYKSAALIGTNVVIKSIDARADPKVSPNVPTSPFDSMKNYLLTVNYLDRRATEAATSTPTIVKDILLNVKNHNVTR